MLEFRRLIWVSNEAKKTTEQINCYLVEKNNNTASEKTNFGVTKIAYFKPGSWTSIKQCVL